MNIGLYQSAAALSSLERWQDAVSQNLSSSQVTGFKRRTVQVAAETSGELSLNPNTSSGSADTLSTLFPQTRYAISFLSGENTPTHRELDMAIAGDGFFEVRSPEGKIAYTRAGEFRVRADRTLVNSQGFEVLSADGEPIVFSAQGGSPVISHDGSINQGDIPLGRISVMKPTRPENMVSLPGGLFLADDSVGMTPVEEPLVQQGYLESSNVAPLREMVDIVSITRAYEANQKLIQQRDRIMEKTLEAIS